MSILFLSIQNFPHPPPSLYHLYDLISGPQTYLTRYFSFTILRIKDTVPLNRPFDINRKLNDFSKGPFNLKKRKQKGKTQRKTDKNSGNG